MWFDKEEIAKLLAYNRTVGELGKLAQCSRQARSFINRTIAENMQTIHELMYSSALTSTQEAGLIPVTSENSDGPSGNARSGSGDGSSSAGANVYSIGVHLQGQGVIGRRYLKITR